MIVAIDPGKNGAFALQYDGIVDTIKMPSGLHELVDLILCWGYGKPKMVWMERVGFWMPGDHPNSATTFARHVGHLESAIAFKGWPMSDVAPSVWMKEIGVPTKLKKVDRKNWIKNAMASRYPHLKVTLGNADALGILTWVNSRKR